MTTDLPTLRKTIEDALRHYQPEQSATSQPLIDAMRYASLGGGKRIRPMLVCATCTGLGGSLADALAPACAVEYIHAYSLIHDDLPAMDDDELRHGLPSTHVKFGEATAILAGDGLQSLAFETLANAPNVAPAIRLRAVQLLSRAIGWEGMVGGQSFDLAAQAELAVYGFEAGNPQACRLIVLFGLFFLLAFQVGVVRFLRFLAVAVMRLVIDDEDVLQSHQIRHDALEHLALGLQGF